MKWIFCFYQHHMSHVLTFGDKMLEEIRKINSDEGDIITTKKCFLLYLNDQVFAHDDDGNNDILSHIVKAMIDLEVELILVHEINVNSPLNLVMGKIPEELVSDVYKIYEKNAIVKYYPTGVYNDASLQEILVAMNALA